MQRVLRIAASLLLGIAVCLAAFDADAKKNKRSAHKRAKVVVVKKPPETEAAWRVRFDACVAQTKEIENAYYLSSEMDEDHESDAELDDVSYLLHAYFETPKLDVTGCFASKDVLAAKRLGMSLKDYVILGAHPELIRRVRHLFAALEELDCLPGVKCNPGLTSVFRDNFRQSLITTGVRARSTCGSNHGGTCRTGGHGDGRAIDAVNVIASDAPRKDHWDGKIQLWKHIDRLGPKFGLKRPHRDGDPPHVEASRSLSVHFALSSDTLLASKSRSAKKRLAAKGKRLIAKISKKKYKKYAART